MILLGAELESGELPKIRMTPIASRTTWATPASARQREIPARGRVEVMVLKEPLLVAVVVRGPAARPGATLTRGAMCFEREAAQSTISTCTPAARLPVSQARTRR